MPVDVDLVVRNGTVVTPNATFAADIAIADGAFVAITAPGAGPDGDATFDATGLHVLPGLIDSHVHFREPGLEYKEDFATGSRAAVMGGITTVIDMPNTIPATSTAALVEHKRQLAEQKSYCDFGMYGLVTGDNLSELRPMAEAGVVGFKCFMGLTTGEIGPPDDGTLVEALRVIGALGLRCGFHAENDQLVRHSIARLQSEGRNDPLAHVDSRPILAELESIQRVALFAWWTRTPIHIFHLTSLDGLATIEAWRARGVDITCEATPQHCFLTSDDMRRLGSILRINPPVRAAGHGDALLEGLAAATVTNIATDHSPHTRDEKLGDNIWTAVSGFCGVETSLRIFLTEGVHAGRLSLQQLVRAMAEGPARTWGLFPRKGAIQVGADADLTIVDLERRGTIREAELHGKNNLTPFEARPTRGAAVATIVRGDVVMRDQQMLRAPGGRMLAPSAAGV